MILYGLEHFLLFICQFLPWIVPSDSDTFIESLKKEDSSSMGTSQDFSAVHTSAKKFVKLLCDGPVFSESPFIPWSWLGIIIVIIISSSYVPPVISGCLITFEVPEFTVFSVFLIWTWCRLMEGCLFASRNQRWAMLMSLCSSQVFLNRWWILVLRFPCGGY